MDWAAVRESLERLRSASHVPLLRPPLSESEVQAFESRYRIRLPADYREFITTVGNGGAGPYRGLYPLGHGHDLRTLTPWAESDGRVGVLSEPFPRTRPWNDLRSRPAGDAGDEELDEWQ